MKFDKETVAVVVLCAVFLIGWEPFCRKMGWIGTKKVDAAETVSEKSASGNAAETPPDEHKSTKVGELLHSAKNLQQGITKKIGKIVPFYDASEPELPPDQDFPFQKLETKECIYEFNPQRGCIARITLKNFLNAQRTAPITLEATPGFQPGSLATGNGGKAVKVLESSCPDKNTYRLVRHMHHDGGSMDIIQTRIWKVCGDYSLEYSVSAVPLTESSKGSQQPVISQPVKMIPVGIYMGEMSGWSRLSGDALRADPHEFVFCSEDGSLQKLDVSASEEKILEALEKPLRWGAVSNKYFAMILQPDVPLLFRAARLPIGKKSYSASLLALAKPERPAIANYRLYVGPKESKYLKEFSPEAADMVHYAWGPINSLAKALLWILEVLNKITGSYGWSIVILTLLVRTVFLPLTMKGNASMQKMAKVQPQVKELKAKYQDNPQLFNAKMLELYKKEGVNPMGGCLPVLVQIPVFFALYAALEGALQLRHVPFLWSPDLAGPDTIFSCTLPFSFFGIGHIHLNPLVLVMTALMIVQQRIVPNSMEPAQRKMMTWMPIFMLLFLYELPSGLTLYWTVSNIFSILQMLWQQRQTKIAAAAAGA